MRGFEELSPEIKEELGELESKISKNEDNKLKKAGIMIKEFLTPIKGDKIIWYSCQGLEELNIIKNAKPLAILSIGCKYIALTIGCYYTANLTVKLYQAIERLF